MAENQPKVARKQVIGAVMEKEMLSELELIK